MQDYHANDERVLKLSAIAGCLIACPVMNVRHKYVDQVWQRFDPDPVNLLSSAV